MFRTTIPTILFSSLLLLGASNASVAAPASESAAPAKHKVVFQVSDNDPKKWNLTLNNVMNMQSGLPKGSLDVEIVAYGPGIGILKLDSKVAARISEATEAGARFVACQNTMRGQHLTKDDMLSDIEYAPSGVIELVKKQEEGYSYIRP